jgi:hypothetical protein
MTIERYRDSRGRLCVCLVDDRHDMRRRLAAVAARLEALRSAPKAHRAAVLPRLEAEVARLEALVRRP